MAELTCPTCHAVVPAGARFCSTCGGGLAIPATGGMARCAVHPEVAAAQTCSRCGNYACSQCLVARPSGVLVCQACAAREPLELLPWDRREELGTLKAYWKTCWLLIQAPVRTFATTPQEGSVGSSALFVFISAFVGLLTTILLYAVIGGAVVSFSKLDTGKNPMPGWLIPVIMLAYGVLVPLVMVPFTMAFSGIEHLFLKLIGAHPASWAVTFRGAALSMAPYIVGLVPLCGLYVYPFWAIVLKVFAYRSLHRTTTGKAVAAALVPTIGLGMLCVGGYAALLFAVVAKSAK